MFRLHALAATVALPLLSSFPTVFGQDSSVSSSQYWHERYHGLLSMAAYGDYNTECPKQTFNEAKLQKSFPGSSEAPWTFLGTFGPTQSGLQGWSVIIPEMDKVVIVFRGIEDWDLQFDNDLVPINDLFNLGCPDCQAHSGAVKAYLEAKQASNDFAAAWQSVQQTGHQYSVTGHAFGGMVAQIAALDLGWASQVRWVHSHGSEKVFNQASANLFNKLFEGQSSQRTVANQDNIQRVIPAGTPGYVFASQGFHIFGDGVSNDTYGMSYTICNDPNDPECLGGDNNTTDTELLKAFYYTSIGNCGGYPYQYNKQALAADLSSLSSSFWATATIGNPASSTSMPSSTPTASANISTSTNTSSMLNANNNTAISSSTSASFNTSSISQGIGGAAAASISSVVTQTSTAATVYTTVSAVGDTQAGAQAAAAPTVYTSGARSKISMAAQGALPAVVGATTFWLSIGL